MSNLSTESTSIDDKSLDTLFRNARTYYAWQDRPVSVELLHEIYNLLKLGPTSANSSPARIIFLTTAEAKERLLPSLAPLNVEKSRSAPVVAIIAYDLEFYEHLPKLFPHADAKSWFVGNEQMVNDTAFRSSTLQGAYFMLAARALGLDCGPMSGFNADALNAEFFPDGKFKVNFICNLGYGDGSKLYPRNPRLDFDEACQIL